MYWACSVVPQLNNKAHYEVLIEFVNAMQGSKEALVRTAEDTEVLTRLGSRLLMSAVSATDYYIPITTRTVTTPYRPGYPYYGVLKQVTEQVPSPALALLHLRTCLTTENNAVAELVVKKITDLSKAPSKVAHMRASTVLLPLVPLLQELVSTGGIYLSPDATVIAGLVNTLLSSAISVTDYYINVTTRMVDPTSTPGYASYHTPAQVAEEVPSPALALEHFKTCFQTGHVALVERVMEKLTSPTNLKPDVGTTRASTVLLPLVPLLHAVIGAPPGPHYQTTSTLVKGTIYKLLASAISATDFYTVVTTRVVAVAQPPGRYYSAYQQREAVPSPALAVSYMQTCLDTGNDALVASIVEKLLNPAALSPPSRGEQRAATVLLPMVPLLSDLLKTRPPGSPPIPGVDRLNQMALRMYLSHTKAPTKSDFEAILQAVVLGGKLEELEKTYVVSQISLARRTPF